jgi:hypothetical protein
VEAVKKEVRHWTDEEALIHVEESLNSFERERLLLIKGQEAGSLWAQNRGGDSAIANLTRLIENYQRMTRLLVDKIVGSKR